MCRLPLVPVLVNMIVLSAEYFIWKCKLKSSNTKQSTHTSPSPYPSCGVRCDDSSSPPRATPPWPWPPCPSPWPLRPLWPPLPPRWPWPLGSPTGCVQSPGGGSSSECCHWRGRQETKGRDVTWAVYKDAGGGGYGVRGGRGWERGRLFEQKQHKKWSFTNMATCYDLNKELTNNKMDNKIM